MTRAAWIAHMNRIATASIALSRQQRHTHSHVSWWINVPRTHWRTTLAGEAERMRNDPRARFEPDRTRPV